MADPIMLTLVLRQPQSAQALSDQLLAGNYDASQTTPASLAADAADVQAVTKFAGDHHLQIVKSDPEARSIRVSGSADDIRKAFGIQAGKAEGSVESLDYKGPVNLPAPIADRVIAVLGLDQTPIARPHAQS